MYKNSDPSFAGLGPDRRDQERGARIEGGGRVTQMNFRKDIAFEDGAGLVMTIADFFLFQKTKPLVLKKTGKTPGFF